MIIYFKEEKIFRDILDNEICHTAKILKQNMVLKPVN